MLFLYLVVSLLWAIYAVKWNRRRTSDKLIHLICFLFNFIFLPIAILIAVLHFDKNNQ